jgi:ABC-type Fe3+-citrate transport system substrate-binding protein
LSYLRRHLEQNYSDRQLSEPVDGHETVGELAESLRQRLREVKLKNTDEDRILRETFRHSDEYDTLTDWPPEEFLETLSEFLDEHIEASTEYQETLVKESEVRARLMCWGVIGT